MQRQAYKSQQKSLLGGRSGELRRAVAGRAAGSRHDNLDGGWARRTTTIACLLLLVLLTLVQVAHVHPAATDADHCPVCVVMHSAAPVSVVAPDPAVVVESAPPVVPVVHDVIRLWHCTLFNRPPPAQV